MDPRAYSILGFATLDTSAQPAFAAYSPSYPDAQKDRDIYKASRPEIATWRIISNETGWTETIAA